MSLYEREILFYSEFASEMPDLTSALRQIDATNDRGRKLFEVWVDRLHSRVRGIDNDAIQ